MNETIFKRDVKQQTTNQSIVTNELPQSSKDQCENLIIQLSNRMYSIVIGDIYFKECTLRLSSYQYKYNFKKSDTLFLYLNFEFCLKHYFCFKSLMPITFSSFQNDAALCACSIGGTVTHDPDRQSRGFSACLLCCVLSVQLCIDV